MRLLNEKTLQKLCQRRRCSREGYLRMRRLLPSAGSEKRHYFRLCGNLLFYLAGPNDDQPSGAVVLAGCMVEPADEREQAATFCLSFQDAGAYQLTASSAEEAALWMHAIIGAAHECALSLASSLQEQLRAITLADAPAGPAKVAALAPAAAIAAEDPPLGGNSTLFCRQSSGSGPPASAASTEFSASLDQQLEAVYQLMLTWQQ